jgi:biotin carboxyl carrier protein
LKILVRALTQVIRPPRHLHQSCTPHPSRWCTLHLLRHQRRQAPHSVVAPLGGVVNSIDVPLGRDVAIGDKVATIEAMKMKTEVRAKFAGKVTNIAVKANDSVETGQVLMTVG